MFAVVDVETTGSHAQGHAITEIGIVIHDGTREVERYNSLFNPGQDIPFYIQQLTGIDDSMVAQAPPFSAEAEKIRALLGSHIFVAHNVNFDFGFVHHSFARLGIHYRPKRLCTVRYARRVAKGLRSYSLGNLCKHFSLSNPAPHRAWGDAQVTAQLLEQLLGRDSQGQWQQMIKVGEGEVNLPAHLPQEQYHSLPSEPGIYFFADQGGAPLYIGKAKNLKKRVAGHFGGNQGSARAMAFKREIYSLHYQLAGSELMAGLLEDQAIRKHWPRYNRAQKKSPRRFGVFAVPNRQGSGSLLVNELKGQHNYLRQFYSLEAARAWTADLARRFGMDEGRCGLPSAALRQLTEAEHQRAWRAFEQGWQSRCRRELLVLPGRDSEEAAWVLLEDRQLSALGFVPQHSQLPPEELLTSLETASGSPTSQALLDKALLGGNYRVLPVDDVIERK